MPPCRLSGSRLLCGHRAVALSVHLVHCFLLGMTPPPLPATPPPSPPALPTPPKSSMLVLFVIVFGCKGGRCLLRSHTSPSHIGDRDISTHGTNSLSVYDPLTKPRQSWLPPTPPPPPPWLDPSDSLTPPPHKNLTNLACNISSSASLVGSQW